MTEIPELPEPSGQVSDAQRGNWVDSLAPKSTRPYLRLSRADRPIGTWLLLLPCWWGILLAAASTGWKWIDLWLIIACAAGAWLMRGAGCTWNDISDRDIDAKVERTRSRPLPSGQVTVRGAVVWMGAQAAIAFCILLTFNTFTIWLAIAALVPVAIYPFAKRFTNWPQLFLGIAFNWGALVGWAAHTGSLSLAPILLYAGGIIWTLFYDTIYAHQDSEDDAIVGVKSTALHFGESSPLWLRGFMMVAVLLIAGACLGALRGNGSLLSLVFGLAGAWAMGWHLTWQLARLDINDPENCKQVFRANRDTGLIFTLFLAAAVLA
ncbi:4-hydroxybenzoate polyprenyltransferase [Actibacterium mucosum KCTC 23349]|uniref:4-hydroxybenzoate octaprenyltransferase n=1 Tax=Actibacterium mucosum KCTC 23349 TaxID=1454373 RepID=A0A037ZEK7_9RHOB|nr:4-hydroxybenzoate octaprenyltransferase [Actibacterium mucosum]KAJ54053.1 4-hydroxybenzoate polyprenyltransferase [Actibacterium mucosum KCTC 23349]